MNSKTFVDANPNFKNTEIIYERQEIEKSKYTSLNAVKYLQQFFHQNIIQF